MELMFCMVEQMDLRKNLNSMIHAFSILKTVSIRTDPSAFKSKPYPKKEALQRISKTFEDTGFETQDSIGGCRSCPPITYPVSASVTPDPLLLYFASKVLIRS